VKRQQLTRPHTDDNPAPVPIIKRPMKSSGLNAGPSVAAVSTINNHPMVYGIQQRMIDNLRPM